MRKLLAILPLLATSLLAACGQRAIRIDLVPVEDRLTPQVIEQDPGYFVSDQIALVEVSGMISDARASSLIATGRNPVSDLRETLNAIERDSHVKAVILRLNTPGGTVTASDMMYRDIMAFKARTHIPVVVSMMDLCASGGFYISCAGDYRIAYPTTITGSIGVIAQTISFAGSMEKLGITQKAVTSGPNKDMLSPLKPLDPKDAALAQQFVNQFYAQFLGLVKQSHPKVAEENWPMLTDGRVVTGIDAAKYGLIDQTGDLDTAVAKAKEMGHIKKAQLITFTHSGDFKGSIYANTPAQSPQMNQMNQTNLININLDGTNFIPSSHPTFLYMWQGQ